MRYKWWFLDHLGAVTIFAIVFVFVVGLDFGIDFGAARAWRWALEQEATVDEVRSAVSSRG